MKPLTLSVTGFIAVFFLLGIVPYHGFGQKINSTDFLLENGTVLKLTPEEMKEAEDYAAAFIQAFRREGLDMGPLNASLKVNESKIKEVQDAMEEVKRNMTSSFPNNQSAGPLLIPSHSSYIDQAGYFHVVGEVQNNTPRSLNFVQVTGTFYNANNQVVGTTFTYTNPSDIAAGGTAPFDLVLLSASVSMSEINTYKLSANAQ